MMTFELDPSKEGIEIYLDAESVDELISYLSYVKENHDHMHLVVGNELTEDVMNEENSILKHVKIVVL